MKLQPFLLLCCLSAGVFSGSGVARADYDPFRVPKHQVLDLERLIVAPIGVPVSLEGADAVVRDLENRVSEALEQRGFRVLPSAHYLRVRNDLAEKMGGLYDPVTGEADAEKLELSNEHTRDRLSGALGVDGVVFVWVTNGPTRVWKEGRVWQAAEGALAWGGEPLHEKNSNRPTRADANFLNVEIVSVDHRPLYEIGLPIEWTAVYRLQSREVRPRSALFADPKRLEEVVSAIFRHLDERAALPARTATAGASD